MRGTSKRDNSGARGGGVERICVSGSSGHVGGVLVVVVSYTDRQT